MGGGRGRTVEYDLGEGHPIITGPDLSSTQYQSFQGQDKQGEPYPPHFLHPTPLPLTPHSADAHKGACEV